jgi:hypothetical protein
MAGGAPPDARPGRRAYNVGRSVIAGVGPTERRLSPRATTHELWALLRTLKSSDAGLIRLKRLHGKAFDAKAFRRFAAFVSQAEIFYGSAETLAPESRPLVAYYAILNLAKAFLICADPALGELRMVHGLSDGFERKQNYWFIHEQAKVSGTSSTSASVFRELAVRTGAGFCYPVSTTLPIEKLAPYLAETADLYEDAVAKPPKLVALQSVRTFTDGSRCWLRAEALRSELSRRGLGPASLTGRAARFGTVFRHVKTDESTASYESIAAHAYGGKKILVRFPQLTQAFQGSLVHLNRGSAGARLLVVISDRTDLLSQEAVSFLVMLHLSNMVRYRPEEVAKLMATKWQFLFTDWVPRATENFLLALTSRIIGEEVQIA